MEARFVERMATDQLHWNEERIWLRAMIDQVPDYLFVKDIDCRFVVANIAVASDLGHRTPAELIDLGAFLGVCEAAVSTDEVASSRIRMRGSISSARAMLMR